MNSDEEKELFENNGWVYDFVKREWVSPSGRLTVTTEDLMQYTTSEAGEKELRYIVISDRVRPKQ